MLGAIGAVLTLVTIGTALLSSGSSILSLLLAGGSILCESIAMLGGSLIGLSVEIQFWLGVIGTSLGGTALGLTLGKILEGKKLSKPEMVLTGIDYAVDQISVAYTITLM